MVMVMGGAMSEFAQRSRDPLPKEFLWMFGGLGLVMFVGAAVSALMVGLAGWCLRTRQAWVYCLIVASFSLLWAPLGTVLGVFSLIVLLRPEAKALFTGTGR
jgi:hypothetical protein